MPPGRCALSVVIPTRDEAPNIEPLVARLSAALGNLNGGWEVVFVDDSDDDTPGAIEAATLSGYPVRLLHREPGDRKGGLGGAVERGFALSQGEVLAVLDGDLQHPPEVIPILAGPVLSGEADLVVGSRYGPGGKEEGLEGPWRRVVSRGFRWLVHSLVPCSRILQDPLSGLFVLSRSVVEGIALRPEGYKILLEIVVRGNWHSVRNVPFTFAARRAGDSKASLAVGLVFLRHLARLGLAGRRAAERGG
ncbi:MAG TPA: glycosyltransferase [Acidimicrobiales bacterium]|nr:glycosyltransferase [Acidimicrobiales bacterium]